MFDLVIIGAAAVGSSAAIYAARRNLNFIVITKDIGGEVALSGEIENWPGAIHTDGVRLAQDFYKHVQAYNVPIEPGCEVIDIRPKKNYQIVIVRDANGAKKQFETKTIIIGSGIHPRELGILGELELKGKGVTYCTVCDGPLFKKKITATVGAGNSALESVLMMSGIANKTYLLTKYPNTPETKGGFPKGENILIDKVKTLQNVKIIYNADTKQINGTNAVSGLVYEDITTKKRHELETSAIMIHAGMIPNSAFAGCLKKNPQGEIEVDKLGRTSVAGIFAGGDVTNIPYKQIVIASGQGVIAALSAIDYLNRWKK